MISQQTIDTVKSTAPILAEHGEALTRYFYERMFSRNPEVLSFFNPVNQTSGTQQRALASAICAYAANIDNLDALSGAVELIANKHASLQVKPEHYPIVGENFLASMREVLGDGATDEVIHAWSEAYFFLADMLSERERKIYNNNAQKPGGWEGFRDFKVIRKEVESTVIISFYLKPVDKGLLPQFLPGQYITLRVSMPNGTTIMRNYSLSDKPGEDWLRISVKKEVGLNDDIPAGYVSNTLHENINVGDTLDIGAPCGEFFLDMEEAGGRPLVFLAAGVGITPILSMLKTALSKAPDCNITFIYGALNEKVQAFRCTISTMMDIYPNLKVYNRYSDPEDIKWKRSDHSSTGFIDDNFMSSCIEERNSNYYFCGPKPFMVSVYNTLLLWNVKPEQIHFEFFGPREELENMKVF